MDSSLTKPQLEKLLLEQEIRKTRLEADKEERMAVYALSNTDNQRILPIVGSLSPLSADQVLKWLLATAHRGSDPIRLDIFSPGGLVVGGLAIYDAVMQTRASGIDVITRGIGYVASMAGVLLQAGTTRQMTPNAMFHIHETQSEAYGGVNEMKDQTKFADQLWERTASIIAFRSHKWDTESLMTRVERKDWWMSAEEALEEGFIDEIVGSS